MLLRKMLIMLAVSAAVSISLAAPAYATSAASTHPASQLSRSVPQPVSLIRSKKVDVKTADHNGTYCAEFKGTLSYWRSYEAGNYEFQYAVDGTLYARCGGTAHLRAYWTPPNYYEISQLIGDTTGTQNIGWHTPWYSGGISTMHVEVCSFNAPVGGCANSPNL